MSAISASAHRLTDVDPVDSRHQHVDQNQRRADLADALERLFAAARLVDLIAEPDERLGEEGEDRRIVIGDHDRVGAIAVRLEGR